MPGQNRCRYCGRAFPTLKGQRGHTSQNRSCRESRQRALARLNKRLAQSGIVEGTDVDVEMEDTPADPNHHIRADHSPIPPAQSTSPGAGGREKISRWVETYPRPAGVTKGLGQTEFGRVRESQIERDQDPWAPFESQEEWQLAQWLLQNVGQNATEEFLKLPIVSYLELICDSLNNLPQPDRQTNEPVLQNQALSVSKNRRPSRRGRVDL